MSDTAADSGQVVAVEVDGDVLVARVDDGKANAITLGMVADLHAALDRAEGAAAIAAVTIIGRPGKFSAGFDLSVMKAGINEARDLLRAGAELALRLYELPKPVVLGCTGHALAMGSILLMACDTRIGAEGPFKIGLNEVAIGMPVPRFAVELARDRLSKRHFVHAVGHAHMFDPVTAVDAGYLDRVVKPSSVESEAVAHAHELAATVQPGAFALTRTYMRAALADDLRRGMDEDMKLFDVAS